MQGNTFIDTNIWLYSLFPPDKNDDRHEKAKVALMAIARPYLSTQVIRETCSNLIKKAKTPEEVIQQLLKTWYRNCVVIDDSLDQSLLASQLRKKYLLSYWDSNVVASALDSGCTRLLSEDMQHGLLVENTLTIVNPFVTQ
jgi:predicted nucleic acid-binding protein